MTKDEVKAVFDRVPTWTADRQQELAEIALEIEAELATGDYEATLGELAAIDEGLAAEAASEEELKRPSPCFGGHEGRIFEATHRRIFDKSPAIHPVRQSGDC
jgi:hypothetical protein